MSDYYFLEKLRTSPAYRVNGGYFAPHDWAIRRDGVVLDYCHPDNALGVLTLAYPDIAQGFWKHGIFHCVGFDIEFQAVHVPERHVMVADMHCWSEEFEEDLKRTYDVTIVNDLDTFGTVFEGPLLGLRDAYFAHWGVDAGDWPGPGYPDDFPEDLKKPARRQRAEPRDLVGEGMALLVRFLPYMTVEDLDADDAPDDLADLAETIGQRIRSAS